MAWTVEQRRAYQRTWHQAAFLAAFPTAVQVDLVMAS